MIVNIGKGMNKKMVSMNQKMKNGIEKIKNTPNWEKCPICNQNLYDSNKYTECMDCSFELRGWKLCDHCRREYYDPDKYRLCFKCYQKEREKRISNGFKQHKKRD